MNKTIYLISTFLFCSLTVLAQEVPIPISYAIIDTVIGDLDKDGINELVVAYDIESERDFGDVPRELIIYKKENGKWAEWKKSRQALYDGKSMGELFDKMEIINGLLLISHSGGNNWKWGHTDKYRYQNGEFYLIGYNSLAGEACEYWIDVDFNLSTGKMIVSKYYENCETEDPGVYKRENETLFKRGLEITLQKRNEKEVKIVTPKYGHEIYISN